MKINTTHFALNNFVFQRTSLTPALAKEMLYLSVKRYDGEITTEEYLNSMNEILERLSE